MVKGGIDCQLTPARTHRRNAAGRAVRTAKGHIAAGLRSLGKGPPLRLRGLLAPQALVTLGPLRGPRTGPALSAYAQVSGPSDFDHTPVAPPGVRVLAHERPGGRDTWAPHAVDGRCVGPAFEHHRCFMIWCLDTRSQRVCDTVTWSPTKLKMPIASSTDMILAASKDILQGLLQLVITSLIVINIVVLTSPLLCASTATTESKRQKTESRQQRQKERAPTATYKYTGTTY